MLADELCRIGARIAHDSGEHAVVLEAIPDAVNCTFRKTDREILRHAQTFADSQGLDWDDLSLERKRDIMEEASADGRLGKVKSDERRIWREQPEGIG